MSFFLVSHMSMGPLDLDRLLLLSPGHQQEAGLEMEEWGMNWCHAGNQCYYGIVTLGSDLLCVSDQKLWLRRRLMVVVVTQFCFLEPAACV